MNFSALMMVGFAPTQWGHDGTAKVHLLSSSLHCLGASSLSSILSDDWPSSFRPPAANFHRWMPSGGHAEPSLSGYQGSFSHRQTPCSHRQTSCNHRQSSCNHRQSSCNHRQSSCNHRQSSCNHRQNSCNHRQNSCNHRQTPFDDQNGLARCFSAPKHQERSSGPVLFAFCSNL